MIRFAFLILAAVQLVFQTSSEPHGPAVKQVFEIESDASGNEYGDNINGFIEQPPPDATVTLAIPTRGAPAVAKTEKVEITKTEEPKPATTGIPEVPATTNETDRTLEGEKIEVNKVDKTEIMDDIEGGVDTDLGCATGPQSHLFRGIPGRDGLPGRDGNPGVHGIPGLPGSKGEPGSCNCREELNRLIQSSEFYVPNIHQCAWNRLNWSLEAGKVATCTFNKRQSYTSLKVEWFGSLRVLCNRGSPCCNRWYITFNGAECSNPITIDGLIFTQDHNATINIHRSTAIAGICSALPKGVIDVALWTGGCAGIYPSGPSRTGWNSASRLIIEEIPI